MGIFSRQVLRTFGETSPFKEMRAPASKNADVQIPKPLLKLEPELPHGSNVQTNTQNAYCLDFSVHQGRFLYMPGCWV